MILVIDASMALAFDTKLAAAMQRPADPCLNNLIKTSKPFVHEKHERHKKKVGWDVIPAFLRWRTWTRARLPVAGIASQPTRCRNTND